MMEGRMSATSNIRRVAVFVCLAAVLLAALTPGAASLLLAIVITTGIAVAIFPSVPLPYTDTQSHRQLSLALAAFSPRPPPTL